MMSPTLCYFCGVVAFLLTIVLTDAPPWSWRVPVGLLLICGLWPLVVLLGFYRLVRPSPEWWVLLLRWIYSSYYWEGLASEGRGRDGAL